VWPRPGPALVLLPLMLGLLVTWSGVLSVPLREALVSAREGRRCWSRGLATLAEPARVVCRLGAPRCPATCPAPAPPRLVLRTELCGPAAWRTRLSSCRRGTLVSCPCGLGWLGRTLVWSSLINSPSHWCCGGVGRVYAPARRARWCRLTSITLVPWSINYASVTLVLWWGGARVCAHPPCALAPAHLHHSCAVAYTFLWCLSTPILVDISVTLVLWWGETRVCVRPPCTIVPAHLHHSGAVVGRWRVCRSPLALVAVVSLQ